MLREETVKRPMNWGTWQGDTGSKGISDIWFQDIYCKSRRELSFPQDVDGRGSGQPTGNWEPRAFKARARSLSPQLSPADAEDAMESTTRAAGGSFLPLSLVCHKLTLDLRKWGSFFVCSLISKWGQEDWSRWSVPPRVPVSPLAVVSSLLGNEAT